MVIEFTKDDLETGMIIKFRNGYYGKVIIGYTPIDKNCRDPEHYNIFIPTSTNSFVTGIEYTYTLEHVDEDRKGWDIIEIYDPISDKDFMNFNVGKLIWERVKKHTMEELIEILGYEFKLVK